MDARKVQVKLYAQESLDASLESYIPAFHRWIQNNAVGEMVFDVADYTHVPQGTGVLLVGHGSDYALDQGEDRPGIVYSRKRALPEGSSLVQDGLRRALKAAELLDADATVVGPKKFSTKEILFRFPDRLHLRNDEVSYEKAKPAIEAALAEVFPGVSYTLSREGEARESLTVRARA